MGFPRPANHRKIMGYLILTRPINALGWTYGKWFSTHDEAQFWIQTLPIERFCYRIIELKPEMFEEKHVQCVLADDDDIPNEVVAPQCSLDNEECESCQ